MESLYYATGEFDAQRLASAPSFRMNEERFETGISPPTTLPGLFVYVGTKSQVSQLLS